MKSFAWLLTLVGVVTAGVAWRQYDRTVASEAAVLFSAQQPGCPIVVPAEASSEEWRAAVLLQSTLARSAGLDPAVFPVQAEWGRTPRRALFVGATRRSTDFLAVATEPAPRDNGVGVRVEAGAVILRAERREIIESAASWFLETYLGAHWFMPGPLGAQIPRRTSLSLAAGEATSRPGFVSRDLSIAGIEGEAWRRVNRLEARFEPAHHLARVFQPDDFARNPEMAPWLDGGRYLPGSGTQDWQPNFLSPAAVEHAALRAWQSFDDDPARLGFSLSVNDSIRFDASPATQAAVAPVRYFRQRPDFSDLVFGFTNAVAKRVGAALPDRYLPALAYYWCENVPSFPVARNLVPFLTADRSQWSHPEFAAADQALIQRWTKAGPEFVGVYDYFYGAPFLVPRPTLDAVGATIPFHYRAGVRAFFAEANPNWALDGPKLWLASQLLWNPALSPAERLEFYYREFWQEASAPMRRFFEICDQAWRDLPGPALWLRFYGDDDQAFIFPPSRQSQLRACLDEAERLARTEAIEDRVAFVRAGFRVTEAFARFGAARAMASRLARPGADAAALFGAWRSYRDARAEFIDSVHRVTREQPLALSPPAIEPYLRHGPDARIATVLGGTETGRRLLRDDAKFVSTNLGTSLDLFLELPRAGRERLGDSPWQAIAADSPQTPWDLQWTRPGSPWVGRGEPWENRSVRFREDTGGRRHLLIASCRTESLGLWLPANAGALYQASVRVRARARAGTAVFLIVNFLDMNDAHLGLGRVDRVPPDAGEQEIELCVSAVAPPGATQVGVAVRVLNQLPGDFADFTEPSLRELSR